MSMMKSLPLFFAALLMLSPVFARELGEKPAVEKAANEQTVVEDKHDMPGPYGHRPGPYGPGPYGHGPCRYRCGYRCCSAEEYAVFSQLTQTDNGFQDQKYGGYGPGYGGGYGPRPGYGGGYGGYGPGHGGGYGCRYRCGPYRRCCSAEEYYAETMS